MMIRCGRILFSAVLGVTTVAVALDAHPVSAETRTVTTTADVVDGGDAFLSLREAVTASTFGDTIDIPAGTYTLQCPAGPEDANTSGDLDINRGITMSGPTSGTAVITINPACGERVIHINAASLTPMVIENLTIRGGRESANFASGGGLLIAGPPMTTIRDSIIEDNVAGPNADGGGIRSTHPLTVIDTEFFDNHAGDATGNNSGGDGGAIAMFTTSSPAPLTITDSIVGSVARPNTSGDGAGVGGAGSGGGVYTDTESNLSITDTALDGNRLGVGGNGVPGLNASGGGVATRSFTAEAGTATITGSTITANQGGSGLLGGGGGIWLAHLDVTITDTTIEDNTLPAAGLGSSAGHGGGAAITVGSVSDPIDVTMTGNTIRNNTIATPGPSTSAFGPGGGNGGGVYIDADSGTVELVDNVFDSNEASDNNVGTTTGAPPAGGGGNVYVSLLVTNESPTPGDITIRGGQIRNGRSGGGPTGTAGWGGGAHLIAGTETVGGTIVIEDVGIMGNDTDNTDQGGIGGGVYARSFSDNGTAGTITVDGVSAGANRTAGGRADSGSGAGPGGAMYLEAQGISSGPSIIIRDSSFDGNSTGEGAASTSGVGGGGGRGGGMFAATASLAVENSTFSDNGTGSGGDGTTSGGRGGGGGAIYAVGAAVTLDDATFVRNATGDGAAGTTSVGGSGGEGGAIFAESAGAVSISGSTFTDNRTGDGGPGQTAGGSGGSGGGASIEGDAADASVTISDSTFTGNAAGDGAPGVTSRSGNGGSGGGIAIEVNGSDVTIDASQVISNSAGNGSNATAASGADARGGFGGDGGGISIVDSEHRSAVSVSTSTVADNTAGDAGGSASSDAGLAGDGGGVFVEIAGFDPDPVGTGTFSLERSTISGNEAGAAAVGAGANPSGGGGGGAFLRVGSSGGVDVDIERSTIHGNSGGAPGSASGSGDGGGLFIADGAGRSAFDHVTLTENDGLNGVNLLTRATNNTFRSTVIGEKADRDLENCNAVGVAMTSNGANVEASEGGFTCGFDNATDLGVDSLRLGPLADNGGPTLTRLPLFGSLLIDTRPCTTTTDQRGVEAPLGGACDTGSTEAEFDEVIVTIDPARFVDTRALGETIDGDFEGTGRRSAGSEYRVQIAGRGDVPADAVGAIINVTAVGATGTGFVTVHQCLSTPPNASSLNHTAGVNLANEIIAGLDDSGAVCFFTSAAIHLTVDVVGYVPAQSPYAALPPARVLETRDVPGATTVDGLFEGEGRTGNGSTERLEIGGRAGVPSDAAAVVINLTAIGADRTGFVTVYPCTSNLPVAASLNYTAGVNRGNELIAQLNDDGQLCIFTSSPIHVTVDVVGHIPDGSPITPVLPQRLVDTRSTTKQAPGSELTVQVTGDVNTAPFVPSGATAAIVNITAVQPEGIGFVTVHPCLPVPPNASSLNYVAGVNGGNELIARLSDSGELCLFTSGATHFTVDIVGYVR